MGISPINKQACQYNFLEYTDSFYARSRGSEDHDGFSGIKDSLDSIMAGFKWSQYINQSKSWQRFSTQVCDRLDPISQSLSLPAFVKRANDLRHHIGSWGSTDDIEINYKIIDSALLTANSGSEAIMFFDSIRVFSLKELANIVKGTFWGTLFSLDFVDYFRNIGIAESYYEKIQEAKDPKVKAFFESKLDFTFLKIVQNVSTIALALLMFISIFFSTFAQGFLFAPITLGLTTIWLALNIFTHYYGQILNTREKAFAPGALFIGKV